MAKINRCTLLVLGIISGSVIAADKNMQENNYSPYVNQDYPAQVYFGDTHLHTSNSLDAYITGNNKIDPDQAYRFAKGEQVNSAGMNLPAKLARPLDFLVVADHAGYLGLVDKLIAGDAELMKLPAAKRWHDMLKEGQIRQVFKEVIFNAAQGKNEVLKAPKVTQSVWQKNNETADRHNQPGVFTAFIGYEWTSMPNLGNNLHRVVVYKDGADKANQMLPFTTFQSNDPEDLWQWMSVYEQKTQGSVLAIAHNGNVSNGLMFADTDLKGNPLTSTYAKIRARWEPLYEVTQMKGDGETHPYLSPDDEFADFETWDKGNLTAMERKKPEMLEFEYARSALKHGLKHEAKLGVNPFKFGMIGSTDAHTGLSAADSDNFFGKISMFEPSKQRIGLEMEMTPKKQFNVFSEDITASGYAAVWAKENTREALFDAMMRRETYATTGPRMTVRFFGGWDFDQQDVERPNYAAIGYHKGVPMGADLTNAPHDKAPSFMVVATKDSIGANLDRIQIVKGWLDDNGQSHEKVYNVQVSDHRAIVDNKVAPLRSTVDVKTASYTNTVGAMQLATVWQDPDFNASQRAFYYVRVLQIPTPRWTTYDVARLGAKAPDHTSSEIQERAYTSPIWYTPH